MHCISWDLIVTIVCTVLASSGFWALVARRQDRKSATSRMLKGLGHDRICYLGSTYIKRGFITSEEYENLHDYLYIPYHELGGNGTGEKIIKEVDKLPLVDNKEGKNK